MVKPTSSSSYEQHLADLAQVFKTVWEQDKIDARILHLATYMQKVYPHELTWVGLYEPDEGGILTTQKALLSNRKAFTWQQISLQADDICTQVIERGAPALVSDLQESHRAGQWSLIAARLNIHGAMVFPIQRQGECLGVLLIGSSSWGASFESGFQKKTFSVLLSTLGAVLHQHQRDYQRQQVKQPAQPFFRLLTNLESLEGLDSRLQEIADAAHQFIRPAHTYVYWFEPQPRYFWRRVVNRVYHSRQSKPSEPLQLSADGYQEFYRALSCGDLVTLGEDIEPRAEVMAGLLVEHFKVPSLMVAPILLHGDLLGFLAVESSQPRAWTDPEQQYLIAAAQLASLGMPKAELEERLTSMKANHRLTAGLVQSIHSVRDWQSVMAGCAEQLSQAINIDGLLVLLPDPDQGGFDVSYQYHGSRSRPTVRAWPSLPPIDWQLLENSADPICIEQLEHNLKLSPWLPQLHQMGTKAAMVYNLSPQKVPEGILIVTSRDSRRWSQSDQRLIRSVGLQVGMVLHQWTLQQQSQQQSQIYDTLQWGLRNLQHTADTTQLGKTAVHHISQLLRIPLVTLVTWRDGEAYGKISTPLIKDKRFSLQGDSPIRLSSDAVVNWAIQSESIMQLVFEDLPDVTRRWLKCPGDAQILVAALRTAPGHAINSVIVLADEGDRRFSEQQLNVLGVLISQLAWCRRYLLLTNQLHRRQLRLAELNWYKQHHIDVFRTLLHESRHQLDDLKQVPEVSEQPYYHSLEQNLEKLETALTHISKRERWQIAADSRKVSVVALLNHLMARAKPLIRKKQLWTKVHCDSNLGLNGEIQKIEFILYELIAVACRRVPVRGRIDIWVRPLDQGLLEFSITDNGDIDEAIITELANGRPLDGLAKSALDSNPGLGLGICQSLMSKIGGEFLLEKLEDGRTRSCAIVPISRPQGGWMPSAAFSAISADQQPGDS